MHELRPDSYLQQLQPLRVPAGWQMGWNTFDAIEIPADGFSGSSLLYLLRHDRRLVLDVEWRPEFDPNGHYNYYVQRQPLRTDDPSELNDEVLDSGQSRSRDEVVTWVNTWLARGVVDAPLEPPLPGPFIATPSTELHPLRLSSGWLVQQNAIAAIPPTLPASFASDQPALLFRAVAPQRRFRLDVSRRPDGDEHASYFLQLLYAPWLRTENGRRREDVSLSFDSGARVMHELSTTDYDELVRYLEGWLWRAAGWAVEGH